MEATDKIWLNGRFDDWKEARVHVLTQALHYGAGVFEGIRCYETAEGLAIFRLDDHIDRFFFSGRCLNIKVPFSKNEIKSAILETIKINRLKECYIRPIAFFGYGSMGLSVKGAPVDVAVAAWPWKYHLSHSIGLKTKISKYIRPDPRSVDIRAKVCGYYANSIFATIEAEQSGVDEVILLDNKGYVAEGPGENIFVVKNGIIYTPALGSILPGITRDSIIKIARDLKFKVIEKKLKPDELKKADEVFFCGTAVEICPVISINGRKVGDGRQGFITLKVKEGYNKLVTGQNKKYKKWRAYVNE